MPFTSPGAAVYVNVVPPLTVPEPASAVNAKIEATAAAQTSVHTRQRQKPLMVCLPM